MCPWTCASSDMMSFPFSWSLAICCARSSINWRFSATLCTKAWPNHGLKIGSLFRMRWGKSWIRFRPMCAPCSGSPCRFGLCRHRALGWASGGTTVLLPLLRLSRKQLPALLPCKVPSNMSALSLCVMGPRSGPHGALWLRLTCAVLLGSFSVACSVGRLRRPFTLQLAPIMPKATDPDHFIVPLLAVTDQTEVTVLMDPGTDGLQLHAVTMGAGTYPEDTVSGAQQRAGMQVFVNGIPGGLSRRPLCTGDYVQLLPAGRGNLVTRHLGPLLERVHELRYLTFPMSFPALTFSFWHTCAQCGGHGQSPASGRGDGAFVPCASVQTGDPETPPGDAFGCCSLPGRRTGFGWTLLLHRALDRRATCFWKLAWSARRIKSSTGPQEPKQLPPRSFWL